mmetsp:Transcript_10573/g.10424  ORF Transcript_10573/g.10424 Transcript_10573/m.10424 type:complete len:86 (-) Transcript_10573:137-394(-)
MFFSEKLSRNYIFVENLYTGSIFYRTADRNTSFYILVIPASSNSRASFYLEGSFEVMAPADSPDETDQIDEQKKKPIILILILVA